MDAKIRKSNLNKLQQNESNVSMTGIRLRYRGDILTKKAYKIPLDYLVYNKRNGRIGTDVKSFEKQYHVLNPENPKDCKKIEEFLYASKKERNDITLESLKQDTQQRYGIVTADGIIIDGNRRAMLLNKIFHERQKRGYRYEEVEHCQYFIAVILPEDASDKDIEQLETIYQMGEDDKLDYDPIQKYLKCKQLKEHGFTETDIAHFMSEKPGQIKKWLDILKLMEEFLEEYNYKDIYTRLGKTEGQFVDLQGYIDSYNNRGANTVSVDWPFTDSDISDLKLVCFDYIRARYEGKEFRDIAKTGKEGSIFFYKDLWDAFLKEHNNKPEDKYTVDEMRQQFPSEDLSQLLKKRDNDWVEQAKGFLTGNLQRHTRKLDDKRAADKPADLIERALSALRSVDCEQTSFYDPAIKEMVSEINSITYDMRKLLKNVH